jgi:hypothetical protein
MTDLEHPDDEVTPAIGPEDVKQLAQAIKEIYAIHGYRPVSSDEFDADVSYEDFVAARRQGKRPTTVVHGNFTTIEQQTLAKHSLPKS